MEEDPFAFVEQSIKEAQRLLENSRKRIPASEQTKKDTIDDFYSENLASYIKANTQCCPETEDLPKINPKEKFQEILNEVKRLTIESYPPEIQEKILQELDRVQ